MNIETRKAYKEVLEIIDLLEKEYKDKIPNKLIDFLNERKLEEHTIKINSEIPLEEQNLLEETIDLLAMLKLNYWCFDEEEKQDLLDLLNKNEKQYQKELQEKYNPDNLFKDKNTIKAEDKEEKEETALIENKRNNFMKLILEKIRKLFSKKN